MGVIPKTTTPLTKFIRTGEGVLVFAFNLAMLIVPIVSNSLSPEDAVKWAGIVNGVAVISRTGLKVVTEFSKASGIEPQPIGALTPQVVNVDAGSAASNGGAPEGRAPEVVTEPTDAPAIGPTVDDDAVEVPASAAGDLPQALDSPDPAVSDEEEFSSVPPASDDEDEDDGMALAPASDDGDVAGTPELVGAGAGGAPNPTVINAGAELS